MFVDWGSLPDWLTLLVAAPLGIATLRQQRTSSDVAIALGIFSTINLYWDRITESGDVEKCYYYMGQILSQFELAAMLFNSKTLSAEARPILKDHIIEVLQNLERSNEGGKLIDICRSSTSTFDELRKFLKENSPHSKLLEAQSL